MRITTQMLANSEAKNGIIRERPTLLDMMNSKSSTASLLSSVGSANATTAALNKTNYTKLETSSDNLSNEATKLASTETDSVFAKAEESGKTDDINTYIEKMVEEYNTTLEQLNKIGGSMNTFYEKQLSALPAEYKTALENIGITQSKDGKLSVDEKKLESASLDTLKTAVGSNSGFISKLAYVAKHIASNATANLSSSSNQYNASGSTYNSFETNKYNFLG